jgi:hypothetical protein
MDASEAERGAADKRVRPLVCQMWDRASTSEAQTGHSTACPGRFAMTRSHVKTSGKPQNKTLPTQPFENHAYTLARNVLNPVARLVYRPHIFGTWSIPPTGLVVLTSNHLFRQPRYAPTSPRRVVFLTKSEHFTGHGSVAGSALGIHSRRLPCLSSAERRPTRDSSRALRCWGQPRAHL